MLRSSDEYPWNGYSILFLVMWTLSLAFCMGDCNIIRFGQQISHVGQYPWKGTPSHRWRAHGLGIGKCLSGPLSRLGEANIWY